ncbi:MAG: indole-3-glycerol phosphate synthase TrpC [Acidobacteria bacterium]|nr:indole-3-glycerol phosphate synthase TrpC [Acidobacteriota bacterium]
MISSAPAGRPQGRMGAPDLLEAIVAATRHEVTRREQRVGLDAVERAAARRSPRAAAFRAGLTAPGGFNVIAECKRRSPSRGVLRADYQPERIARDYEAAGAAAISVLTEPAFFDGALRHLEAVRAAVALPLLRKDFIVSRYQLAEARAAGADAALLIVAALADEQLRSLLRAAMEYGLAALVEVHDRAELARALEAEAAIVGVNNRNLRTLEVDLDASHALIAEMPPAVVSVAESGLRRRADLAALRQAGYDAFLVGESFMTRERPGAALREMLADGEG